MKLPNRRQFLVDVSKALGGLALMGTAPTWAFATRSPHTDLVHRSTRSMGTSIGVSIPTKMFDSAHVEAAFQSLYRVDSLLSAHGGDSSLMIMNNSPGAWQSGRELVEVSRAAGRLSEITFGALDVTVLPAMRRFGFIPGSVSDLDRIDFSKLEVRGERVRIVESGFGADFGGIAKGYGVDEAISTLRAHGVHTALLDAGGDLFAMGRPDPDRLWKVGIRHPFRENQLIATVELENEAAATSGTYVQKKMVDGKEVSHLMDPKTGKPVNHVVSSTITAPDAMTADGLATATSIMQPLAAQALIESLPDVGGFWIYADGSHYVSRVLRGRLQLL